MKTAVLLLVSSTVFAQNVGQWSRFERAVENGNPYGDPYRELTLKAAFTGPKTVNRKKLSQGLLESHHAVKPLYAQETLWAGNKFHKEPYTDVDLRKNAYVLIMSASAINFGDMNGDSSSGFSGPLEMNELVQNRHDILKRVWDYFDTLPFWRLKPRQHLLSNGF